MYMYEQSQRPTKPRNPIGVRSSDAIARCCCGHEAMRQAAACCLVVALGITLYYVHVATDALRLGCKIPTLVCCRKEYFALDASVLLIQA
ncbi:unnamed protein product [Colias eurytheme]|nr:unnamed protein product [Colias eurytheme]